MRAKKSCQRLLGTIKPVDNAVFSLLKLSEYNDFLLGSFKTNSFAYKNTYSI